MAIRMRQDSSIYDKRIAFIRLRLSTYPEGRTYLDPTINVWNVPLGAFLTAMTFDRIHVEFYMTKFSFLTVFSSLCVSAAKTPYLLPCGAIAAVMLPHSLPTIHLTIRHHNNKQI